MITKTKGKTGAQILRERLKQPEIIVAPGAYDCLSARIIEQCGFEAMFMTGYGASASILGEPDYGLMTMNEMVNVCANMHRIVNIPIIGDIDTGYGNPLNVYRTVQEFERAGLAAVHLEDQVFPKRCGHMENKAVISMEEHVEKIHAAVDARKDMMIIARTDARATHGLDETIRRLEAYRDAGADIVYADALRTDEELKAVGAIKNVYKFANQVENGKTPLMNVKRLEEFGFDIVIFPTTTCFAAAKAMQKVMRALKEENTTAGILDDVTTFNEFTDIVGMKELQEMEKKYRTDDYRG